MNEILKAMRERRSVRKFKPDALSREQIDQIVEAGLYAASGRGSQESIIIAVTNKDFIKKLSAINCKIGGWDAGFDPFYGAQTIFIVLDSAEWPTRVYDGSLAIGNMMLAAHALGRGSCWMHRAKEEFETDEYKTFLKELGVEGNFVGVGHLAVGYAVDPIGPPPARKEGRVYRVE